MNQDTAIAYFPFEYDLKHTKDNQVKSGEIIYIPEDVIALNKTPEDAFEVTTGFAAENIISYNLNDARNVEGEPLSV